MDQQEMTDEQAGTIEFSGVFHARWRTNMLVQGSLFFTLDFQISACMFKKYLLVVLCFYSLTARAEQPGLYLFSARIVNPAMNCGDVALEIEDLSSHEKKVSRCGVVTGEAGKLKVSAKKDEFLICFPLDKQFRIRFATKGMASVTLLFDTRVPTDAAKDIIYDHREGSVKISLFPVPDSSSQSSRRSKWMFSYSETYEDFAFTNDSIKAASFYYTLGLNDYERGNFENAINFFSETLYFIPKDIPALTQRANAKYKMKDIEGACTDWMDVKNAGSDRADKYIQNYCNQGPSR